MSQDLKTLFRNAHESRMTPQISCIEVGSDDFFEKYNDVVVACGVPVMCLPVPRGVLVRFEMMVVAGPGESNVGHVLVKEIDPESFDAQLKKASQNVDI